MIQPGKIVCVGRNYAAHAKEMGNDVPTTPIIFLKPTTGIIRDGENILLPQASKQVEFEGEIGIVIGRELRHASEQEAGSAVAAVVAMNDVTARDIQRADVQWTRAKGFDTFCPIGNPATNFGDLHNLEIITRVNGVERQRATASQMVFGIAALLSFISGVMTLHKGDVVMTGTPEGVGPLRAGDVVEVEIAGLSKVSNTVKEGR